MKGNNIVLIGMMGAGKTSVGELLQKELPDYIFVDIDSYIENEEGISITEMFQRYTEKGFRRIEEETISEISKNQNQIISIGGGAFESKLNRDNLLNSGKVFYLYAPTKVLYDRIKMQGNRPMLQCENPQERFARLLEERDVNYRQADYIVDTTLLTKADVVKEILRSLDETVNIG